MFDTTESSISEQPVEVTTQAQDLQLTPIEQENIRDIEALKEKYPYAVIPLDEKSGDKSVIIDFTKMNENLAALCTVYGTDRAADLEKSLVYGPRRKLLEPGREYDEMRWLLTGKDSKVSKEFLPYGVALLQGNQNITITPKRGVEVMGAFQDLGGGKPLREVIKTEEDKKAFEKIMGFVDKYNRLVLESKQAVNRSFATTVWEV